MATWDAGLPLDTDEIRNGAKQIRDDKQALLDTLSEEHDFPNSGKHKDINVISGDFKLHNGICLVNQDIAEDAEELVVDSLSLGDANYAVFFETSWETAASIRVKDDEGFTIAFGTAVPAVASPTPAAPYDTHIVSWMVVKTGAA